MTPMSTEWIENDRLKQEEIVPAIRSFVGMIIRECRFNLRIETSPLAEGAPDLENPELLVNFSGRDSDLLLERGAELLRAIEYLTLRWLKLDPRDFHRVRFDCQEYKTLRIEELKLTAQTAAERVRMSGQAYRLNPMNARERRIVHLALKDDPSVRTVSEGVGTARQVVIYPASSAPPRTFGTR